MTAARAKGSLAVGALLLTAVASGAAAGLLAACFIWLVESGTDLVWTELPDAVGVDPFDSWWLFAIPAIGGVLVGLGQRFLGNYPRPIDEAVATWRAGGHLPPSTAPKTFVNALVALVAGGPVGFEAALTGLLGGSATWIGARIRTAGHLVRQAWGAEPVERLPRHVRSLPYWLAALAGLVTYRHLPFGAIDLGFRFDDPDGRLGLGAALAVAGFAALVTVPAAWAVRMVGRAEEATVFRRSPELVGLAGGLLFALLALGDPLVLFSGQQGIQSMPGMGNGELLYVAAAKWVALVVALLAGWRGGPIFPIFTSVAALGVVVDGALGVGPDLLMLAGISAASVVFARGRIPVAFVLTLYVAPLAYAGVILLGCVGAATTLALVGATPRASTPAGR